MPLPCILGGFKSYQKQFFEIFKGKNCGNIGKFRRNIGIYRKKSEISGKNRTNEISVHFSFRGSPKNDISAKYRPKKPKFLSILISYNYNKENLIRKILILLYKRIKKNNKLKQSSIRCSSHK